jgi:hypothetical protein
MAVNYHGKKFYKIDPSCQFHKTFFGCNLHPQQQQYTDSAVIYAKKVL